MRGAPWWEGIAAAMELPSWEELGLPFPAPLPAKLGEAGSNWGRLEATGEGVSAVGGGVVGRSTTEDAPTATSSFHWPVPAGFGSILNLPWMGRFLPVWGSLSKGMFVFPQGDEYRVLWVLQGMFFSFTVHLVPPWKQMLYNLLSEGPLISSSGSTSHWLGSSPQVEKGEIMLMRETRPIPPTSSG